MAIVIHERTSWWVIYHGSLVEHHGEVLRAEPDPACPGRFRLTHNGEVVLRQVREASITEYRGCEHAIEIVDGVRITFLPWCEGCKRHPEFGR